MQDSFTSPSGFVGVSFPDTIVPRPKVPMGPYTFGKPVVAEPVDIRMGWMPRYPTPLARLRPVYPARQGVGVPFYDGIAPLSWAPTILQFLAAPRLHLTFPAFGFDPLSGEAMNAAIRMAWDPRNKAPLITRPRFLAPSPYYVTEIAALVSGAGCVEMLDVSFGVPALTAQALTTTDLLSEGLTATGFINEDLC